jgi:hypothetical protein
VPWTSGPAREAGAVHVADTLASVFRAPQQAGAGHVPDEPVMVVGQHSLHDPTRAPAGRHTLYAYTHVPQRPDIPDDAIADRMERRIEAFAPGFQELIRGRTCRSPAGLEADNASLVGGDILGGSLELDQQLVFRPAPELFRGRTPLPGLYIAGASVQPSPPRRPWRRRRGTPKSSLSKATATASATATATSAARAETTNQNSQGNPDLAGRLRRPSIAKKIKNKRGAFSTGAKGCVFNRP